MAEQFEPLRVYLDRKFDGLDMRITGIDSRLNTLQEAHNDHQSSHDSSPSKREIGGIAAIIATAIAIIGDIFSRRVPGG